jgi:hypothetical protein
MRLGVPGGFMLPVAISLLLAANADSAAAQRLQCDRCHGELELLRQRVTTLADAERLLVPATALAASAHAELSCAQCHTGTAQWPHAPNVETKTCASCHAAADTAWRRGVHARVQDRDPVSCTSCHGVHDVLSRAQMAEQPGLDRANDRCISCHESQALPGHDAHAGKSTCAGCHGAHDVHEPDAVSSPLHPSRQLETCGACHEEIARRWRHDVHADTLRSLARGDLAAADPDRLPGCTACHGAHGMTRPKSAEFGAAAVARCAACHEHDAESYYESYHGQAVRLGSQAAASCADCHGAHGIRPSSEPVSRVAEANLIETCGGCHEQVRPAFVAYDSHPEPHSRARNPVVFFAFWSMNALLVGTMTLWALHTALWWLRLRRKGGTEHGANIVNASAEGTGEA